MIDTGKDWECGHCRVIPERLQVLGGPHFNNHGNKIRNRRNEIEKINRGTIKYDSSLIAIADAVISLSQDSLLYAEYEKRE